MSLFVVKLRCQAFPVILSFIFGKAGSLYTAHILITAPERNTFVWICSPLQARNEGAGF